MYIICECVCVRSAAFLTLADRRVNVLYQHCQRRPELEYYNNRNTCPPTALPPTDDAPPVADADPVRGRTPFVRPMPPMSVRV